MQAQADVHLVLRSGTESHELLLSLAAADAARCVMPDGRNVHRRARSAWWGARIYRCVTGPALLL